MNSETSPSDKARRPWKGAIGILPGVVLCLVVAVAAIGIQAGEERAFAHPYVEALVIAILLGTLLRSIWQPGPRWQPGIAFSAKILLEIAIVILGASITFGAIMRSGPALLGGIVATVILALAAGYGASRLLALPVRMAVLIACGNAICGNSAIAAVAPVIGADGDEIASSIAFTAILGVVVVLALPLCFPLLHLSETQYGALAGLTVYAVPQVLAATVPIGPIATQVGTLVKLVRVLMLGPVVLGLSLVHGKRSSGGAAGSRLARLVPWFILGFLLLAALRSFDLIPVTLLGPMAVTSGVLTIVAMAALGLGVDLHVMGRVGSRVTTAVVLSLLALGGISFALIRLLKIT